MTLARGLPRRNLTAGPRRAARRPVRSGGQGGGGREHPQNPTGKVLDEEDLESIAELCRTHDRFAIADEIYEHITYDAHRHRCLALCEGMAERPLVVNSISKTGRATGWRVGWVITSPERTPALRAVHDNLVVQAPTPLQKGALSLLRQPRSFFAGIAEGYRQKRDLLVDGLREIGFAVTPPEGAYYLFADYRDVPALAALTPTQAAMFLIERVGVRIPVRKRVIFRRRASISTFLVLAGWTAAETSAMDILNTFNENAVIDANTGASVEKFPSLQIDRNLSIAHLACSSVRIPRQVRLLPFPHLFFVFIVPLDRLSDIDPSIGVVVVEVSHNTLKCDRQTLCLIYRKRSVQRYTFIHHDLSC